MTALLSILAQGDNKSGGSLFSILILVLPLAAMAYLFIVPQRKQKQKQADFLSKLGVGDEVVTSGGVYGVITHLEDDVAHLEVDTDVVIRVSKGSLARAVTAAAGSDDSATGGSSADDEADDAKKR